MRETSKNSCGLMKSVISVLFLSSLLGAASAADDSVQARILRKSVLDGGFAPAAQLYRNPDEHLAKIGKTFFESKRMSLNGDIACRTCHLAEFGSADGVPLAAAIHGQGEGPERLRSGAKLLPRNALAFWGRGAVGFDTFFWDGRVQFSDGRRFSQFASQYPSDDALTTAAHLPVVEIREMLDEDKFVSTRMRESVTSAQEIYRAIRDNLLKGEAHGTALLAQALGKPTGDLEYVDVARSVAAFIRSEFRLRETKLERFINGSEKLSPKELAGGLLFYGRGNCVACHRGPHFSDFNFHVVAFPQLGFGRNGFGVDYGRFNATFHPDDLYKFRTPPLFNVERTAPYGHSGSARTLHEAVVAHFDPLRLVDVKAMSPLARHEFYKRLTLSQRSATAVGFLDDAEVSSIVAFLGTLSF